jgi:hypothetical protein
VSPPHEPSAASVRRLPEQEREKLLQLFREYPVVFGDLSEGDLLDRADYYALDFPAGILKEQIESQLTEGERHRPCRPPWGLYGRVVDLFFRLLEQQCQANKRKDLLKKALHVEYLFSEAAS